MPLDRSDGKLIKLIISAKGAQFSTSIVSLFLAPPSSNSLVVPSRDSLTYPTKLLGPAQRAKIRSEYTHTCQQRPPDHIPFWLLEEDPSKTEDERVNFSM
eukprot:TRINITY_DN1207_c0_g1_i13.p1 TRINITY_DN1207_c0_g1~~TRINITY_DN1207_c0_g1_i13.p1  ORF type:complete len:100 (-),score=0.14 TRINITY_DN1207_c0_g1_i13:117-416(-)